MSNGQALPILIAGGGIGGLAAAHALARKGFAVRVLEQAPEFREIGAGIQLGPNVFRALEKLDLKEAVLADAHRPPAMEMRCALSGERVTRIPLDEPEDVLLDRPPVARRALSEPPLKVVRQVNGEGHRLLRPGFVSSSHQSSVPRGE